MSTKPTNRWALASVVAAECITLNVKAQPNTWLYKVC